MITSESARIPLARTADARSLSTTASTPWNPFPRRTTGIPPPPATIRSAWCRAFRITAVTSLSTISRGRGDGTTRRHPPCGSFTIRHPFARRTTISCSLSYTGPTGFVGSLNAGSAGSTTTCVTTLATVLGDPREANSFCKACWRRYPIWAWDSATHTSRGIAGTRWRASSFWIRMFPTCGPFPCVTTSSYPASTRSASRAAVFTMWDFIAARPVSLGGEIALPPTATTARVMGSQWESVPSPDAVCKPSLHGIRDKYKSGARMGCVREPARGPPQGPPLVPEEPVLPDLLPRRPQPDGRGPHPVRHLPRMPLDPLLRDRDVRPPILAEGAEDQAPRAERGRHLRRRRAHLRGALWTDALRERPGRDPGNRSGGRDPRERHGGPGSRAPGRPVHVHREPHGPGRRERLELRRVREPDHGGRRLEPAEHDPRGRERREPRGREAVPPDGRRRRPHLSLLVLRLHQERDLVQMVRDPVADRPDHRELRDVLWVFALLRSLRADPSHLPVLHPADALLVDDPRPAGAPASRDDDSGGDGHRLHVDGLRGGRPRQRGGVAAVRGPSRGGPRRCAGGAGIRGRA